MTLNSNVSFNNMTIDSNKTLDDDFGLKFSQNIVYSIISFLGTFGNVFVLVIVIRSLGPIRGRVSTIFLINQSLLDATISILLGVDCWLKEYLKEVSLSRTFLLWYCHGFTLVIPLWGTMIGSSYNLVLLSLERYFSVLYPVAHKNLSKKKAVTAAVLIWFIFIGYQFAHQSSTSTVSESGKCIPFSNWPNDLTRRSVGILIVIIQFIIPLIIIGFSYISLAITFSKRSSSIMPSQHAQDVNQRVKKNSIKTFALVAFAFVICWIFNQTYFLGFYMGLVNSLTSSYYHFSRYMVFLNCCINPFIYTFRYGEFRKELRKYSLFRICNRMKEDSLSNKKASSVERITKESKC